MLRGTHALDNFEQATLRSLCDSLYEHSQPGLPIILLC